jgi:CBS domain-containing protein
MNASDVMRTPFVSIKPGAPLLQAAQLLLETNQRALPVINNNDELLGILSEGDFLHRDELGISPPAEDWLGSLLGLERTGPARARMSALRVEEVMTKDPLCIDDEASLDEVIALMDTRRISQLPVVCGGAVVGMISRVELLKAIERKLRESETPVATI